MEPDQVIATDTEALKKAFIPAPESPEAWPAWREKLRSLAEKGKNLGPTLYDQQAQSWASRAYAQGFVMLWDHELIDHNTGEWKVEALCDRAERDFGGYDVIVLWNNYPLSGIDARHQIAYYDELPGGRAALREAANRFRARGVRVIVDHKPWVPNVPEGFETIEDAYVDLVRECELDGVYLDCSAGPEESFRKALEDRAGAEKIFCSEAPATLEPFGSEACSWQQMTDDSEAPGTYRNRWLDRQHLVYECRRYFYDPIRDLQRGWMNGSGFVVWENVFGYWASYSPRIKSWLRLVFPAQRFFADHFVKGEWEPLVGGGIANRVYVSRWRHDGRSLWTVINRRSHAVEKGIVKLPRQDGCRFFDILSGQELNVLAEDEENVTLRGRLEGMGLAGILATPTVEPELQEFLFAQQQRFAHADWSAAPWDGEHRKTDLPHVLRPVQPTQGYAGAPDKMVRIPDYSGWMVTRYRMRECGYIAGAVDEVHVYDVFESTCEYSRKAAVAHVAIDAYPVTNADYHRFVSATGYQSKDSRNFLAHWSEGRPPEGKADHPVVYVSLTDARAYAEWAGKRLPTEEEWQRAAQGAAGSRWPWGDEFDESRCAPEANDTYAATAFPTGRTPEGVFDLCGNTWEMTESERTDGHTRYQILKGGSWYKVDNSFWLFDGGAQPADWGAKHILLCDAWDRCATIGFRCVVDLE